MAAIKLDRLTLGYGGESAVESASGAFAMGRSTVVVGPNGSGKSTLLKAIAGRMKPVAGGLHIDGVAPRQIAWLPQEAGVDRAFPIALADFVALGFERRLGLFRGLGAAERAALADAIAAVGLEGLERRPIASLSGGQFQRALFARVIAEDAPVILLDEPFAGQDSRTTADLICVIDRWRAEGRTLVIVLHDLALARSLGDETLVMARGCLAWGPTAEVLTPDHLRRAHEASSHWRLGDAA
jgi:zinc/manganese transport system ATP-binding protein